MSRLQPGEIWRVDLGLAAKVRPCLTLSEYPAENELALAVIILHTTAIRGNRWELPITKPFLKPGVFHHAANPVDFLGAFGMKARDVDA